MPTPTETLRKIFKDIANAIRGKDGTTEATDKIHPEDYATRIEAIQTGVDTSDATAAPSDISSGKTAYGASGRITGTLPNFTTISISGTPSGMQSNGLNISASVPSSSAGILRSGAVVNVTSPASYFGTASASDVLSGKTFTSSAGLKITGSLVPSTGTDTSDATASAGDILSGKTAYISSGKVAGSMPMAGSISGQLGVTSGANWSTSDPNRGSGAVSITGVSQTPGYTPGFSGNTFSVTVPANRLLKGRTITPTTSSQKIAEAEDIAYGSIVVAGDPNLISSNIKSGVSIFGVSGSLVSQSGTNTSDATATASDIAKGKTAYGASGKVTGTVEVQATDVSRSCTTPEVIFATDGGTTKYLKFPYTYPFDVLVREGVTVIHQLNGPALGNATAADVASGKTFTSSAGFSVKGTLTSATDMNSGIKEETIEDSILYMKSFPTTYRFIAEKGFVWNMFTALSSFGNATAADVAAGKTFTSSAGLRVTGTAESNSSATVRRILVDNPSSNTTLTINGLTGIRNASGGLVIIYTSPVSTDGYFSFCDIKAPGTSTISNATFYYYKNGVGITYIVKGTVRCSSSSTLVLSSSDKSVKFDGGAYTICYGID